MLKIIEKNVKINVFSKMIRQRKIQGKQGYSLLIWEKRFWKSWKEGTKIPPEIETELNFLKQQKMASTRKKFKNMLLKSSNFLSFWGEKDYVIVSSKKRKIKMVGKMKENLHKIKRNFNIIV